MVRMGEWVMVCSCAHTWQRGLSHRSPVPIRFVPHPRNRSIILQPPPLPGAAGQGAAGGGLNGKAGAASAGAASSNGNGHGHGKAANASGQTRAGGSSVTHDYVVVAHWGHTEATTVLAREVPTEVLVSACACVCVCVRGGGGLG